MLVTAKAWYMPRRVYGHVVGSKGNKVFVLGSFGLGEFHRSSIHVCKLTQRVLDGANAPRKSKRSTGSPRK